MAAGASSGRLRRPLLRHHLPDLRCGGLLCLVWLIQRLVLPTPRLLTPAHLPPLQYDWRFGALVRLVKLWAKHQDINNSQHGTLNSHAITLLVGGRQRGDMGCHACICTCVLTPCVRHSALRFQLACSSLPQLPGNPSPARPPSPCNPRPPQCPLALLLPPLPFQPLPSTSPPPQVVFHLQTRSPPVLPPISQLFPGEHGERPAPRPLEDGDAPDFTLLRLAGEQLWWVAMRAVSSC